MPRLTAGASLPPPSSSQDQDHFAEGKEVRKRKGARAEWNHPEASGSLLIPCTPRPHGRNRLRPNLTEGRSVLKEVEGPSPKTGQLLVLFVVLLVKTFTEREGTLPICAPARPSTLAIPARIWRRRLAARTRLICIFPGGGSAACFFARSMC